MPSYERLIVRRNHNGCVIKRMSIKYKEVESAVGPIKNEFTRQRWELFHRAIAHAKQSNDAALLETDGGASESQGAAPQLSIVR